MSGDPESTQDGSQDFLEALGGFFDEQRIIEANARRLVHAGRAVLEHRSEYRQVDAGDFAGHDAAFYDGIARELALAGARVVGDVEDAAFNRAHPDNRAFYRFALSADDAIVISWFAVPGAPSGSGGIIVMRTFLADGRALHTTRGASPGRFPTPPQILDEAAAPETSAGDLLGRHRSRVGGAGTAPTALRDLQSILDGISAEERRVAEWRRSLGADLFHPMLQASMADGFHDHGVRMLEAIRKHPEWWTEPVPAPDEAEGGQAVFVGETTEGRYVGANRGGEQDPSFPHRVLARLWEPIQPQDRAERYEDPLEEALQLGRLGAIAGGGSQLTAEGEIAYVEIHLDLADLDGALERVKQVLGQAGAPAGSELRFERNGRAEVVSFGTQEGLAIYLDGVNLPAEVYEVADGDALVERITEAVQPQEGAVRGYWTGPRDTAIYVYGPDADELLKTLEPMLQADPQCQNARVVIRHGSPAMEPRTVRLPMQS
jgi:hypothetical protein